MTVFDKIIDNLLDENIDLMININNTLDESDKKLESIENNNSIISIYNLKNWNILNRISNIWNRFIFYKETDIDKIIQMKEIEPEELNDNIYIKEETLKENEISRTSELCENNISNIDNDKINHLKYYSKRITNKLDEQKNILEKLTPNIEDTNFKLNINNSFIKKL